MEFEHPSLPAKKLDSYIAASENHSAAAWEVKYDRKPPSGKNQPRSSKAGGLIDDVFRLAGLSEVGTLERVLIYVSDQEMLGYYMNPGNQFASFLELASGQSFTFDPAWLATLSESGRKEGRKEGRK
jgi:hypothetical protein